MGIPTSWDTIAMPHGNLRFNIQVGDEYYPLQVWIDVPKITTNGVRAQERVTKSVGTPRALPFEVTTVQGMKDLHNALPTWARVAFKEAIINAINEDASA